MEARKKARLFTTIGVLSVANGMLGDNVWSPWLLIVGVLSLGMATWAWLQSGTQEDPDNMPSSSRRSHGP